MPKVTDKNIREYLQVKKGKSKRILDLIKEDSAYMNDSCPALKYRSVQNWMSQCFNRPNDHELILCAINQILEGHGVECIRDENVYVSRYYGDVIAEYINMGDTYLMTIVYDTAREKFLICSWGDFYESYKKP